MSTVSEVDASPGGWGIRAVIASSPDTHTAYAPFDGQPVSRLAISTSEDVRAAVARARRAQRTWSSTPVASRAEVLLRFHDLVLDRQDELLDMIQRESGKSRIHAFEEIAHLAMTARYCARIAAGALRSRRRPGIFPVLTRVDVDHRAKGVVGIISPWNYPLTMALCDGIAALVAGNAVVHKPDEQTRLTALLGVDLLFEAGLPEGVWNIVLGAGPTIGAAVVDSVDYVCFTGSTATGRLVAGRCAERLIGCSLELGGKNPMLVLRDADLDRAAEGAVRGCFSSAGQLCVSMERLYVADQVYERFMSRFIKLTESLVMSTGLDYRGQVGSLVSAAQLVKVSAHVDDARGKGAVVVTGGRARPDIGPLFYQPTILTGVRPGMDCFAAETFGPVVSVYRFAGEDDAVARANEGEFGLNASVWTRDGTRGRAIASRLRCGTVNVNEAYAATFGSLAAPMGGMKSSGVGRRQGTEGVLRFVETQSVATQRAVPIGPAFGLSNRGFAAVMTRSLRLLNRLHRP